MALRRDFSKRPIPSVLASDCPQKPSSVTAKKTTSWLSQQKCRLDAEGSSHTSNVHKARLSEFKGFCLAVPRRALSPPSSTTNIIKHARQQHLFHTTAILRASKPVATLARRYRRQVTHQSECSGRGSCVIGELCRCRTGLCTRCWTCDPRAQASTSARSSTNLRPSNSNGVRKRKAGHASR